MIDPDSGEVDRDTVLLVLRFHKVDVSPDPNVPNLFNLARGDEPPEAKIIDPWVGRRMIQYLKRRFAIPVHHFYRPEMMTGSPRFN